MHFIDSFDSSRSLTDCQKGVYSYWMGLKGMEWNEGVAIGRLFLSSLLELVFPAVKSPTWLTGVCNVF